MRVLYMFGYSPQLSGVMNKVIAKISWLEKLGVDVTILCITGKPFIEELRTFKVIYVKPRKRIVLPKLFNFKYLNFLSHLIENRRSNAYLKTILDDIDFDLIIFRYGMANYFSYKLTKHLNHKFVFEHNTNEIEQFKLRYKNPIASHSWITYEYFSEKIFGPKQLKHAAGIVGVTNEITDYEVNRISKTRVLPLDITISNGINVEDYNVHYPTRSINELNMVMLLGVNSSWNGLDRIINGIKNYKGDCKVTLYVIGDVTQIEYPNVVYLGYLKQDKINHFFESNNIHVAVATLALHRKKLNEASALKVREYLARGIPFVLGYDDTDLEKDENIKPFIFRVKSDDSAIDINAVVDFYTQVSKIENYPRKIRAFAKEKVDMSVKMQQYKDFLSDIMEKKKLS